MNKLLIGSILACGLLLAHSPDAAAHEKRAGYFVSSRTHFVHDYRRDAHSHDYYKRYKDRELRHDKRYKRAKHMPKWMEHNRSFKRWLDRTRLDRNRHLTWYELFDIYLWERSYRYYPRY